MQIQLNIGIDQLIDIVKKLPAKEFNKLKTEMEHEKKTITKTKRHDMETLLLNAPVFTKKQLETIAKTRKAINQWRTK